MKPLVRNPTEEEVKYMNNLYSALVTTIGDHPADKMSDIMNVLAKICANIMCANGPEEFDEESKIVLVVCLKYHMEQLRLKEKEQA